MYWRWGCVCARVRTNRSLESLDLATCAEALQSQGTDDKEVEERLWNPLLGILSQLVKLKDEYVRDRASHILNSVIRTYTTSWNVTFTQHCFFSLVFRLFDYNRDDDNMMLEFEKWFLHVGGSLLSDTCRAVANVLLKAANQSQSDSSEAV